MLDEVMHFALCRFKVYKLIYVFSSRCGKTGAVYPNVYHVVTFTFRHLIG